MIIRCRQYRRGAWVHSIDGTGPSSSGRTRFGQSATWMPWAWCNLSRNPFGEMTPEERASLAVVDVVSIRDRVARPFHAVQLIGDCGRGKTTRLLVLSQLLPDASYVYLPEDKPCPAIAGGCPVLIDEAQRLPRRVRQTVFRSGMPLVLATHRDLGRVLRRAGYQVHTQQIGDQNRSPLIRKILNRRIEFCRLGEGSVPEVSVADANWLFQRFGSDIRAMEGFLYEQVQKQVFSDGPMRFVD